MQNLMRILILLSNMICIHDLTDLRTFKVKRSTKGVLKKKGLKLSKNPKSATTPKITQTTTIGGSGFAPAGFDCIMRLSWWECEWASKISFCSNQGHVYGGTTSIFVGIRKPYENEKEKCFSRNVFLNKDEISLVTLGVQFRVYIR